MNIEFSRDDLEFQQKVRNFIEANFVNKINKDLEYQEQLICYS